MNATELNNYLMTKGKLGEKNVTLFLMNGFQMRGRIMGVHDGWLTFSDETAAGKEKEIFFHAISTID